jgi:hypothetical protein
MEYHNTAWGGMAAVEAELAALGRLDQGVADDTYKVSGANADA